MGKFKIIFLLCVLGSAFAAYADSSPVERIIQMEAPVTHRLSIDDVTQLGLTNNFDIQLVKYDILSSRTQEDVVTSLYDTLLSGEVSYQDNRYKRTSTILGTKDVDNDYNVGLSKKTPTGTTFGLDVTNNRNNTNSSFATSTTTHDSSVGLSLKQELGRNFFGLIDRANVKLTRLDIENAEYVSMDKIEDQIAMIQKAYWDLVLEYQNEKNQMEMVAQARRLYDLQKEKLIDGLVELAEAIASEANYQQRLSELALVQNQIIVKENNLKTLLNLGLNSDINIVPQDSLDLTKYTTDLKEALTAAVNNRRDYKKVINSVKQSDVSVAMKKNSRWPQVDLTASWSQNGLGDHFDESLGNSVEEDNFNAFLGLTFSMPLENSKARAELKQADYRKAKALIELKQIENIVALDIVNQFKTVQVSYEVAEQRERVALLQEQKLSEEQKRFNSGRSSTDTLIRFQEDAIQAKMQDTQSKYNYIVSLIDLNHKQGTLLDPYWKDEL